MKKHYRCQHMSVAPELHGFVTGAGWDELPWSSEFVDITGEEQLRPHFSTRVKMGWDERFFYIGAAMEEPHIWATITTRNARMFEDNDFEIFLDPDDDGLNYYEFEINALGTIWELSLPRPYQNGGQPRLGCNIDGLVSAVGINGTLNDPSDEDEGWSVTVAIPWTGLKQYHRDDAVPPASGDRWRVNFSRVQWEHTVVNGNYVRIPPHGSASAESLNPEEQDHPENNWAWCPQGTVNMHIPERWGWVTFVEP